jgi:hypothetical protein
MDTRTESQESPLARKLVDHFGGRKEAEKGMNVNRETLRLWLLAERGIPLERALDVEEKTGGAIAADEVVDEARRIAEAKKATA